MLRFGLKRKMETYMKLGKKLFCREGRSSHCPVKMQKARGWRLSSAAAEGDGELLEAGPRKVPQGAGCCPQEAGDLQQASAPHLCGDSRGIQPPAQPHCPTASRHPQHSWVAPATRGGGHGQGKPSWDREGSCTPRTIPCTAREGGACALPRWQSESSPASSFTHVCSIPVPECLCFIASKPPHPSKSFSCPGTFLPPFHQNHLPTPPSPLKYCSLLQCTINKPMVIYP